MMAAEWPALPYKGLSYYGSEDVQLFASRERDVERIASRLADFNTKILILHGRTGCGKSSFLRAGLIPYLERPEHGFRFLREQERHEVGSQPEKALFVRSTENPLSQLAEEVYEFCSRPFPVETPIGKRNIDLPGILNNYSESHEDFVEICGQDQATLNDVLGDLADALPGTLVIVIDQAEEVLTLWQGTDEEAEKEGTPKDKFFDFLANFTTMKIDLKLLVTIRTEFFGEFFNEIHGREWRTENIRQEVLKGLTRDQIVAAIKHPTNHARYSFKYAEGVPETIASDLKATPVKGGELPVMQIVCGRLYEAAKERAHGVDPVIITMRGYKDLGGLHRQVYYHVEDVLRRLSAGEGVEGAEETDEEVDKWCQVLDLLVRVQADGTVTTEQKTKDSLEQKANDIRCKISFTTAAEFLADQKQRILQRIELFNIKNKRQTICYSLGHDAIGLALTSWKEQKDFKEFFDRVLREDLENRFVKSFVRTERRKFVRFVSMFGALWALYTGALIYFFSQYTSDLSLFVRPIRSISYVLIILLIFLSLVFIRYRRYKRSISTSKQWLDGLSSDR